MLPVKGEFILLNLKGRAFPSFFFLLVFLWTYMCMWVCMHLLFIYTQVKVINRNAVVTGNAETTVVEPKGLQEAIDSEVGKQ